MFDAIKRQFQKSLADGFMGNTDAMKEDLRQARKGQFAGIDSLAPMALAIVSLAIILGVGALVLNEMDNATTDADAGTVIQQGIDALIDLGDFLTVIVVIGVAAVIFLLLNVVRRTGRSAGA